MSESLKPEAMAPEALLRSTRDFMERHVPAVDIERALAELDASLADDEVAASPARWVSRRVRLASVMVIVLVAGIAIVDLFAQTRLLGLVGVPVAVYFAAHLTTLTAALVCTIAHFIEVGPSPSSQRPAEVMHCDGNAPDESQHLRAATEHCRYARRRITQVQLLRRREQLLRASDKSDRCRDAGGEDGLHGARTDPRGP